MDETKIDANRGVPQRVLQILTPTEEEKQFRQKLYPDVSEVENAKILCTICQKDLKHVFLLKKKTYKHIFLQVAVCKSCLKFYEDGEFSVDEDGDDKYCRWCGQGGTLCLCSNCSSTFCKKCIRTNLERKYQLLVDKDDWKCFFCDPKPLYKIRALSWAIDEHIANIREKEEAQKLRSQKKTPTTSKARFTTIRVEKPEYPAFDVDQIPSEHVSTLKLWMTDMYTMVNPDVENRMRSWSRCRDTVDGMRTAEDFVAAITAMENFIESDIDKLVRARKQFIDGLAKFKDEHRNNGVDKEERERNSHTNVNGVEDEAQNDDPNVNDGEVIVQNDDKNKENGYEKEEGTLPKIRLRNLSDLMEPKLSKSSLSGSKAVPSSDRKPEPASRCKPKLSSNSRPKPNRKKSVELITLSSDDDSDVPLKFKEVSSKMAESKGLTNPSKVNGVKNNPEDILREVHATKGDGREARTAVENDDEPVQPKLFTSSESEGEGSGEPKPVDISRLTDFEKTSEDMFLSGSEKEVEKEEQKSSSKNSSKSPSPSVKDEKTSKNKTNADSDSSSDSTSSSDPLSGSSSDEKKTSSKKVNRSYFSGTDSGGSAKKKSNVKTQRRNHKKSTIVSSSSDSDMDGKNLRKKRMTTSTPLKKSSEMKEPKKSKSSQVVEASDDDSLDMDIEKLCDLKSLRPKRGHSSSSSSGSTSADDVKGKKQVSKKVKPDGDKLSDFYDSADDEERVVDGAQEDDLEATLKREFPQYNLDSVIEEDVRASILNMSSSSEQEVQPASSEEDSSGKKSKSESSKTRKENAYREKTKGKKRYADKLMEMNIDSDSDDMEKGGEKYAKLKEKRAAKSDKESDGEDNPIVKKKVVAKRKGKPRKKMFSDSDESPMEDDSDEKKSDKEDSEDEDDDKNKKKKKKKKSASDSNSSEDEPKKATKKRRRIKAGSDSSGSDTEGGGKRDKSLNDSGLKGRKSIRRILKEDDLKQTTQAALKSEQERKRRIAEKQKLYNAMVEITSEKHKELSELVLDFNPKTKEKIVVVDPTLVKKLKPHQGEGIKFMWDSCFETLEMAKTKNGSGCILAHCMGLGKSLQVVTLVHTLLTHPEIGVKTILVVAPVSTVLNWANEFDKWLKDVGSGQDVNVFHMTRCQANHRAFLLNDWSRQGGVLIMGYNLLRTLSNPKARVKASFKKVFQEKLVDPGPDIVVCDEGHILKNEKTAISITMSKMKTRRRIVLTGTPLQNNLVEYHCMVQFVKPSLLGTKKEFTNRFVNPIQNGQFEDSTPHDVKIMKRRAHVLHTMLDGLVQRKDYNVLTPYLPPKFEYVIHLKLSDVQVKLYRYYLLNMVHGGDSDSDAAPKGKRLFVDFQNLMWICLHPRTLLMKSVKDEKKAEMEFDDTDEEGSLKEFIDDGSDSSSSSDFKTSSSGSDKSESEKTKSKPTRRKTRGQGEASDVEEELPTPSKQWWSELIEEEQMDDIRQSSKLFLLFTILKYCEEIGDKLLIFSQSLYTLDLLEYFLDKIDEESQKPEEERIPGIKGFEGSWAKGLDYFRLDGSSACENRESWCKSFNRKDNVRARLFLISTRAGGLGINLTGANRVIIFDASWNPSFDVQSLFRVYRFGQEKPCYIYRFLSKGTMEEKIYERQVAKLSTALRVIDEQQIDRHFSHSALAELYMFDPEGSELQGTPALPKDRLMAELLQNHSDIILSHHQHDSLLENQEDQGLSEEERKAAWAEFENEKNQKPPVFQNTNMMGTLVSMMMEIRTKLKMQNPAWTEDQLRIGALQILQQYPDFKTMAPYLGMIFQQQQLQQQQLQQQLQGQQARPGLPMMSNPQFPGGGMVFPNFQYPMYNNSLPQMNNLTAGRLNNAGQINHVAQANNVGQAPNALLEKLLQQNAATNVNSLLVNPKHAAQNSQPKNLSAQSLQKVQPPTNSTTTGAGTSTEPIELDDSGTTELEQD